MNKRYYYLLSLTLMFIVPSAIAGYFVAPSIPRVEFIAFVLLIALVGSFWDLWATRHGKRDPIWIWTFNRKDTVGLYLFGLPVEEYLFYVFSSVYVVFIWKSLEMATDDWHFYLVLPIVTVWTFVSLLVAHRLSPSKDRLIG